MNDEEMTFAEIDNIFEALDLPDERARVELACVIVREIRERGLSRAEAAKLLKTNRSDVSALLNARLDAFSMDRLERLLNALDMEVRIQVGPRPAGKERAGITVQRVDSF